MTAPVPTQPMGIGLQERECRRLPSPKPLLTYLSAKVIAQRTAGIIVVWCLTLGVGRAETMEVDRFSLASVEARLVYIDFWASWCPPCKASFPWMQQLSDTFGDQGLKVIAVNVDRERLAAERFIDEQQPGFDIVLDPDGRLASEYGIRTMPSSFLVRPDGTRIFAHSGFRLSDRADLEAEIGRALAAPNVVPSLSEDTP